MLLLGLTLGLMAGAIAGWLLRPKLELRLRKLPFVPAPVAEAVAGANPVVRRLEAEIAEIEAQIRQGVDRERNATRLQILREVVDGN